MPVLQTLKQAFSSGPSNAGGSSSEAEKTSPAKLERELQVRDTPALDHEKITVIYVLGGPGVGKGTQCSLLVRDHSFVHLSAGDLLRAEQAREGSEYGEMISRYIREGLIVPMEVTIKLLENAMFASLASPPASALAAHPEAWSNGRGRFLIDGFPRKLDQAVKFDESVCISSFVLFFSCSEEVMLERLMERGKTSGREDDNRESIVKRFRTFQETSMPVVNYYREKNKVVEVDGTASKEEVYAKVRAAVESALASKSV